MSICIYVCVYVCICVCMYARTYTTVRMYVVRMYYACRHVSGEQKQGDIHNMHVCIHVCMYMSTSYGPFTPGELSRVTSITCMYVCMYTCMYVYEHLTWPICFWRAEQGDIHNMYVCVYVYEHLIACMYVCIYVFI